MTLAGLLPKPSKACLALFKAKLEEEEPSSTSQPPPSPSYSATFDLDDSMSLSDKAEEPAVLTLRHRQATILNAIAHRLCQIMDRWNLSALRRPSKSMDASSARSI